MKVLEKLQGDSKDSSSGGVLTNDRQPISDMNVTEKKDFTSPKIVARIAEIPREGTDFSLAKDANKKRAKGIKRKLYGYELIMDLYDCDLAVLSSRKKLQEYVDKLCKLIKMKKFGKTLIPYFGEREEFTKGYSLVQLIETSSITGHFSDHWRTAYLNIFSCKTYNQNLAKNFTKKFFGAKKVKTHFLKR
ncbi:MAG: S-adenosylmethionine decarboxylase [Candidatus Omnitrophica bacterium]|nr:S-adenosylmethionine decarboxylase [Candidatus Omnitrophota bacterium]MBU1925603.1 S-adenosylmethionine decarboxylase [Candidatus Omnitrophota bacterium]